MSDVAVKFVVGPQKALDADFVVKPTKTIETEFKLTAVNKDHNELYNRGIPDQHPIDAITGLRDILDRLWTFTFEQEIAEKEWTITHNLGRHPSFVVVDSAGNVQMPDEVTYNNDNQITIKFISAFAGKAYFN